MREFDFSQHPLYEILIYANHCESKYIPFQIKILERLRKKPMLYDDLYGMVIQLLHNAGYSPVTEEGEESRFNLVMAPLRKFGLVRAEGRKGKRFVYKLSDGGLFYLRDRQEQLRE